MRRSGEEATGQVAVAAERSASTRGDRSPTAFLQPDCRTGAHRAPAWRHFQSLAVLKPKSRKIKMLKSMMIKSSEEKSPIVLVQK